ncbi:hypothetical protein QBC45DRAFT_71181 [Copromyces sp. CBS 386.78]|nr:hypothetical protein QBC45DRAFT_71181 [Copromyces sp. CBS 386.78]
MGRRKIEIKAIKDDRNRSVTFLKRKGGLFKKAHELSVLCSVDVAVIIFGNNKKLYEYSSSNIRDILQRYTYHGGPNEHKGPSDFNGGADDDDDDDENGTNSQGEQHMMYQHNPPVSYPFLRHTSLSDSPPVPNGAFGPQPGHQMSRAHTPQPPFVVNRPPSVNDIRRLRPGQPVGPAGVAQELQNRSAFVPSPPIYNPQPPATMAPTHGLPTQLHPQYPFQPSQPPAHPMQQFEDQRRSPLPPTFVSQPPPHPAQRHSTSPPELLHPHMPQQQVHRHSASPQVHQAQLPQQPQRLPSANMSPPPPQPAQPPQQQHHQQHQQSQPMSNQNLQPPAPPKPESMDRPRRLIPSLNTSVKNPGQGSVFTPIEPENKSILSQHFAAFRPDIKSESPNNRSHSVDGGNVSKPNTSTPSIQLSSAHGQGSVQRTNSLTAISQSTLPPPSRGPQHLRVGGGPLRPRLKVQIPDDSDSGSAAGSANSPRVTTTTDSAPQPLKTGPVLPPPSPSASNLPSAGATGPPNPFAPRSTIQHNNNMNIDTPVSALPSRFLGDLLPSPSRFYPEWGYGISGESNTLPSPLNFATPVNGTGPSFLRDDPTPLKRKSPESKSTGPENDSGNNHDAKRMRLES